MNINNSVSLPTSSSLTQDGDFADDLASKNTSSQPLTFTPPATIGSASLASSNDSLAFNSLMASTLQNLKSLIAQFSGASIQPNSATSEVAYADSSAIQSFTASDMSTNIRGMRHPEGSSQSTRPSVPRSVEVTDEDGDSVRVTQFIDRTVNEDTIRSFTSTPHVVKSSQIVNGDGERVDDHFSGHFIEGDNDEVERFRVAAGQPKRPGNNLDPRAEARFNESIDTTANRDYEFNAQYDIVSAKATTVFQILSTDTGGARGPEEDRRDVSNADRHIPVLFLEAETSVNDEGERVVDVVDRESGITVYSGPSNFRLKVETNGREATVTAHPDGEAHNAVVSGPFEFDRKAESSIDPAGETVSVRYGAYHHDNDRSRGAPSLSTANVKVSNARLETVNP